MTVDITSNTTTETTTTTAADVPQTSEEQTSPLPSGKGHPDRCLNARLLSKFGGDVALVEKHLEKMRRNREGKRADILAAFGPSVEILTQRGFGDHLHLPWLLKKFEGDAEKIIERIQNNANKRAVAGGAGRGVCRKIPRSPASASPSSSSSSSSDLSPSSTESLSSDATPSLSFPSSSSSSAVSDFQQEIAPAPAEEPKESRKAKMQMIKQQIKDLQAQMKEMQTENAAQIQLRVQKRKQRLERLHDQEARILEKISTLKQKTSNTNDKIQRHEQQLERVRGVIAKLSAGPSA